MRYILLSVALALAACAGRLDAYEDAARRVRQVCVDNGNAVGSPAFNECFNTIWGSTMAAQGRGTKPAAWPFPASAPAQPVQTPTTPAPSITSCQDFGGIVRCR